VPPVHPGWKAASLKPTAQTQKSKFNSACSGVFGFIPGNPERRQLKRQSENTMPAEIERELAEIEQKLPEFVSTARICGALNCDRRSLPGILERFGMQDRFLRLGPRHSGMFAGDVHRLVRRAMTGHSTRQEAATS
jgi:hypothetical protein